MQINTKRKHAAHQVSASVCYTHELLSWNMTSYDRKRAPAAFTGVSHLRQHQSKSHQWSIKSCAACHFQPQPLQQLVGVIIVSDHILQKRGSTACHRFISNNQSWTVTSFKNSQQWYNSDNMMSCWSWSCSLSCFPCCMSSIISCSSSSLTSSSFRSFTSCPCVSPAPPWLFSLVSHCHLPLNVFLSVCSASLVPVCLCPSCQAFQQCFPS